MIKRTIKWTRPDATVEWPWIGLPELDAFENWVTTECPHLLDRHATETETTYELTFYFDSQEICDAFKSTTQSSALVGAQIPILALRGIDRQETEETM